MQPAALPSGLYVITDSQPVPADRLVDRVALAIAGGAVMVQFRDKQNPAAQRERTAVALAEMCRQRGVPLIINDDIGLAARVDAAGVHLGQGDATPGEARARLGDQAIIGVSCYNRLERARQAQAAGASYVAFGRFFPSTTKPGAVQARTALLTEARRELELPVVAIGGITPENGSTLVAAGAHLLAVVHGVFGQTDTRAAARHYANLFETQAVP